MKNPIAARDLVLPSEAVPLLSSFYIRQRHVDDRDCRLLIELMRTPFDSLERIGRRLGMQGKAAKARLDRLSKVGILQGFACGPSPQSLGLQSRLALYLGESIDCHPRQLLTVPGAVWAAQTYPTATTCLVYSAAASRVPAEVATLAGRAPDRVLDITNPGLSPRPPLSPLDWRVMAAVMEQPRGPLAGAAKRAGLTPRTVRDRRDRMYREGDLFAFPALDASQEVGTILYGAYVRTATAEDLRGVSLSNAWRLNTHHDPPATFVYGYVRTYAETRAVEEKLKQVPGALEVHFTVPQGTWAADDHLRDWVDERIRMWQRARPKENAATRSS
jgi:DNA-binding Lrp family transcriptional regulator